MADVADADADAGAVGSDIVLVALNARWHHASFALRYLKKNLGPALLPRCTLLERTIAERPADVVEEILARRPRLVGLSVYIWNAPHMLEVARLLKQLAPEVVVVVGGPEVSHELDAQPLCQLADVVVTGEGEHAFRAVCERALGEHGGAGSTASLTLCPDKVVRGGAPALDGVAMPYDLYDDDDLAHRMVYVEASRGCPFTCAFCLSALDDGVRTFALDAFLEEMERLWQRGLSTFKFVDRTFNLRLEDCRRVLQFFLDRVDVRPLSVHFEMIPDRLPDDVRALLARFPPGVVQLEVGVQSFHDDTTQAVARRQDVARIEDNLRFLADHTDVHVHADLIAGLPHEDLATFARGFDRLHRLGVGEIQVGLLKRLRGAPLSTQDTGAVYSSAPPYEVLRTDALTFFDVQRLKRFARVVDLVHNSGNFPRTCTLLVDGDPARSPFGALMSFADWLHERERSTQGIALSRLGALLSSFLAERAVDEGVIAGALERDIGRDRLPPQLLPRLARRQSRR